MVRQLETLGSQNDSSAIYILCTRNPLGWRHAGAVSIKDNCRIFTKDDRMPWFSTHRGRISIAHRGRFSGARGVEEGKRCRTCCIVLAAHKNLQRVNARYEQECINGFGRRRPQTSKKKRDYFLCEGRVDDSHGK